MHDAVEANLAKPRFDSRQNFFWTDVERVFNWCDSYLPPCHERLDATILKQLATGEAPQPLLDKVRADLSYSLKEFLPWDERISVVNKVLKNPHARAVWMNCPISELHRLPKRIRDTVADGERQRRDELHATVFSSVGDQQMADYCRVWQSQDMASLILIALARRELTLDELDKKKNEAGKVSLGRLRLDEKRMVIQHVKTSGSLRGRGVAHTIFQLARDDDWAFFVELGQVLRKVHKTKVKQPEVNWDSVNELARLLASKWCCWPGNCRLPPLCLFENGALARFCCIALGKEQRDKETSANAVRKWVSRLRLVRAKEPRIREVRDTPDGILFI